MPFKSLLAHGDLPLDLHSLAITEHGELVWRAKPAPINFSFVYGGIRFAASLAEEIDAKRGHLKLVGDVGPMPFSAESVSARASLVAIIEAANDSLGGVFKVSRENRILLGHEFELAAPVTAVGLIEAVAGFLLGAVAYLDCIGVFLHLRPGESTLNPVWRRR